MTLIDQFESEYINKVVTSAGQTKDPKVLASTVKMCQMYGPRIVSLKQFDIKYGQEAEIIKEIGNAYSHNINGFAAIELL